MRQPFTFLLILLALPFALQAQVKIGDNLNNVNANAILELESTTKALLLPRLNNAQIQAMQNVPAGMLVYSSTDNVLMIRTNTGWTSLISAANSATATGPFTTTGSTIYTTASKVGIGTSNPFSQLANNSGNTSGSDGQGGNTGSLSWAASQQGYVGQIYNSGTEANNNGLVVKVNSTTATALDVSQGPQNGSAAPLLTVKSGGQVGIGINDPYAQLANTAVNTTGSDLRGGGRGSLTWAASQLGYVGQIYNGGSEVGANGLVVKVNSSAATAFDVSRGTQNGFATSLLTVKSDGKVGIKKADPSVELDVNGEISANNFNIGIQYIYEDYAVRSVYISYYSLGCPNGTKVIGGGGGHRDSNVAADDIEVAYSGPDPDKSNFWKLIVNNNGLSSRMIRLYVICAKVN